MQRWKVRSGIVAGLAALMLPGQAFAQSSAPQDFSWMFGDGKPAGMRTVISGSMTPTLQVGDRTALFTLTRAPRRGDIITFRHPRLEHSIPYVKRVVGLPGDTVQMKAGRLYINGTMIARTLVREVNYLNPLNADRIFKMKEYSEQLPGEPVAHLIHEYSDEQFYDDTQEYKVPEGNLFMMGDNRDYSQDSRARSGYLTFPARRERGHRYSQATLPEKQSEPAIGFVPIANIIGRVASVLYSVKPCDPVASKAASAECLVPYVNKRL